MAHLAPVLPARIYEQMMSQNLVPSSVHLMLAHHVVEEKETFWELKNYWLKRNQPIRIIMDNSLVELGQAVSLEVMREACSIVGGPANVIPVLPDVMGDGVATINLLKREAQKWVDALPDYKFMTVIQGASWDDFLASVEWMHHNRFEEFLRRSTLYSVPRIIQRTCGSRVEAVHIASTVLKKRIHLLGFSNNHYDDIKAAQYREVASIDSAVPYRITNRISLYKATDSRGKWWEEGELSPHWMSNHYDYESWLQGSLVG